MSVRPIVVTVLALAALAACGGEVATDPSADETSASSPTTSPSGQSSSPTGTATEPACAEVWVDGATLPEDYAGCVDESGQVVPAEASQCAVGSRLVTFAGRFYAMTGHVVNDEGDLAGSATYASAKASCGG